MGGQFQLNTSREYIMVFLLTFFITSSLEQSEIEVLALSHVVGEDDLLLELEDRDSGSVDRETRLRLLRLELVEYTPRRVRGGQAKEVVSFERWRRRRLKGRRKFELTTWR